MTDAGPELDPVIHAPKRLRVMAILVSSEVAEFRFLRDELAIKDADLSKQMSTLHDAGYVSVRKTKPGRGSTTWYRVTARGRRAFENHIAALREVIDSADPHTVG